MDIMDRVKPGEKVIGEGSYGVVVARDNQTACKYFKHFSHLIQELFVTMYMSDSHYVVSYTGYNLSEKSMSTKLYDMSLRSLMNKYKLTYEQRLKIFTDILVGLHHIHSRKIGHGDIKHTNIMVNINPLEAYIGDMGLSSVNKYTKVKFTALGYRLPKEEIDPNNYVRHDLYSLAVLGFELFCLVWIDVVLTPKKLFELINRERISQMPHHTAPLISEILKCFALGKGTYTTAYAALKALKINNIDIPIPVIIDIPNRLSDADTLHIKNEIYELTTGEWKINRGNRGFWVLIDRLNCKTCKSVDRTEYPLYIVAVCLILSSVFGEPGYSVDAALNSVEHQWTETDLYIAISSFLNCQHCLNFMMMSQETNSSK